MHHLIRVYSYYLKWSAEV